MRTAADEEKDFILLVIFLIILADLVYCLYRVFHPIKVGNADET